MLSVLSLPETRVPGVLADISSVEAFLRELAAVKGNVARLEAQVNALKALVAKVCLELGIRN